MGLVSLILGGVGPAAGENSGGTEVEVRQGNLSRWSAWWAPGEGAEGRFWWEPEAGGAAWFGVGEFQWGALKSVAGPEGIQAWGPGTRQAGTFGAAWSGRWAGAWAVQKSDAFETGLQLGWRGRSASLGAGGSRNWTLGPGEGEGARWTDEGFAGGTWQTGPWKAGAEVRGQRPDVGDLTEAAQGRVSVGDGPWEVGAKGGASTTKPWTARGTFDWRDAPWSLGAEWDRSDGVVVRLGVTVKAWGLVWAADSAVKDAEGALSARGGVSVGGNAGGRWGLGWSAGPEWAPLVQKVSAQWKGEGLEASADWTVEGFRLGWFGPGSRLTAKLRFLF